MTYYLLLFDGFSFLFFGLGCWVSPHIKQEFIRYGLPGYRKLTGLLQLLGAAGIGMGHWEEMVWLLSTAGLAILMALGFGVRMLIRDSFLQSFPAMFYCFLNFYLFFRLLY